MFQPTGRKKRKALKELGISKALRRQIVEGALPPGAQLPKRTELEREFSVSPVTLQRALQQLMDDGFIYAKVGQGTFVAQNPPHLSHFGLVFPSHPNERETWTSFYTALNNEAMEIQRRRPGGMTVYYGLYRPELHAEREKLIQDVEAHRLAGIVFASTPRPFADTPILDEPRVARVAIMSTPAYGMPAAVLDGGSLVNKALDFFASRGRKRIALIVGSTQTTMTNSLLAAMAKRGMETRPYWVHSLDVGAAEGARSITHVLCLLSRDQRPDGLYIVDDNFVPHATAGLLAAGMSVPQDMDVVAHGNFPWLTPSVVPVKRVGYDARQILSLCLQSIDLQRRQMPYQQTTLIHARSDDEVDAQSM